MSTNDTRPTEVARAREEGVRAYVAGMNRYRDRCAASAKREIEKSITPRPTPETDALYLGWIGDTHTMTDVFETLRRLEQQRDEAREENKVFADKCRQELIDLRAERDEWRDQFHAAMDNVRGMEAEVDRLKDRNKQSPEYLSILEAMLTVKAERDQLNEEIADLRADKARLILRLRHNPMKEAKP